MGIEVLLHLGSPPVELRALCRRQQVTLGEGNRRLAVGSEGCDTERARRLMPRSPGCRVADGAVPERGVKLLEQGAVPRGDGHLEHEAQPGGPVGERREADGAKAPLASDEPSQGVAAYIR